MSDPKCMPIPSDRRIAELRAGIYAFLAAAWRDPDESLEAVLLTPERLDFDVRVLEAPAVTDAVTELRAVCARLRARRASTVLHELVESHTRLFGHSVRGTCPPYELEYGYGEIIQQTAELADLTGFYSAFGLDLMSSAQERADHVSVECEFMAILCAKEAWGRRKKNSELADACGDAQRLFLRDHLARWLPAFAHRVAALDQDGFHGQAASLASAFLAEECRRFDIEAGPQWLELRPADPARDAAIDCDGGGCAEAAGDRLVQLGLHTTSET